MIQKKIKPKISLLLLKKKKFFMKKNLMSKWNLINVFFWSKAQEFILLYLIIITRGSTPKLFGTEFVYQSQN